MAGKWHYAGGMFKQNTTVSLADLTAAGIQLRPHEAVTLVRELSLQLTRGQIHGVPSAHVIRMSPDGVLSVEGPVAAVGSPVVRAAQLLESLLPGFEATPELRVPGAIRLIIGRALGSLDLPPYPTLEAFIDALGRFAGADPVAVVRELVASWDAATHAAEAAATPLAKRTAEPTGELTISDIRRARRATGLTLIQIEERSRIPLPLLRQLEWGYFHNWPAGHYGRTQLVRYARAAGLDERVVVDTVWPELEATEALRRNAPPRTDEITVSTVTTEALVPVRVEVADVEIIHVPREMPKRARVSRARILAALAVPALIAVALFPASWPDRLIGNVPAFLVASDPGTPAAPASVPAATTGTTAAGTATTAPPPESRRPAQEATTAAPGGGERAAAPAAERPADPVALADGATYSPAYASAGSAMFYQAEANGGSALMRADTDGGGAVLRITRIVDDSARNFHVRPSPDGNMIAFDSDREGERAVYIADANGTNVRRLTGEGYAAVPSWSPDGRTLAIIRAEENRPDVWNLWTVDVASGRMERLTDHRVGQPWGGSWFPDGRRIAYSHETRLIVLDLDSGARRIYPSPREGRLVRTPAVSPDGRRIIFQVRRDGAWLLDLRDGSMRRILADPTAEEYTWSPDGRRVAYHSRRTGNWGVWVMSAS